MDKVIKKKLQTIQRLVKNPKRIDDGFSFMIQDKEFKIRLRSSVSVYKSELILKADCELVVDGLLWLGYSYGDAPKMNHSQDMIDLYDHVQSIWDKTRDKKRAEVNRFIDDLLNV